ncbi:amidohydrolase [Gordonia sp. ABSL1-1]|uniref:amidohydrolase n=1 Tax=Gordonia sp. ABSL1-1 TaxID=3053923 RepID=UPI00257395F7|nr:amidohydrolase [Gordonia sp. ABSL1-1]MDL9937008.1 amidohydrolase [Gordonia sp. ABSL1-1]
MTPARLPDPQRLQQIRRDLHAHPELAFAETRTAQVVADRLTELGVETTMGIGGTGVVGVITGATPGPTIGLRADMDALPIDELPDRPHRSRTAGVMHACGHDGHVAMLLGAAEILSAERDFAGTVVLVFQPAEEGAAGAPAMLDDNLIERFGIEEIYGLHNIPGIPAGDFAVRPGTILASFDDIEIAITAAGAHAMAPHMSGDVVAAGSYLVTQLQTIVARRLDPLVPGVVAITSFHAGATNNVMPTRAELRGTVRCLDPDAATRIEQLVRQVCASTADVHGVHVEIDYTHRYPCTVNDPTCAARAAAAVTELAGADRVDGNCAGILAAEDFSFFLQQIPGAYAFIGNGPVTADAGPVHSPTYDFNDGIAADGARYLAAIARAAIAARK